MKRLTELHVPAEWEASLLEGLDEVPRLPRMSWRAIALAVVVVVVAVVLVALAAVVFHYR